MKFALSVKGLLIGSLVVMFGRFTVPGHGLSYAGTYEALAHMWVGFLIGIAFLRTWRVTAIGLLVVLSLFEILKFLAR